MSFPSRAGDQNGVVSIGDFLHRFDPRQPLIDDDKMKDSKQQLLNLGARETYPKSGNSASIPVEPPAPLNFLPTGRRIENETASTQIRNDHF